MVVVRVDPVIRFVHTADWQLGMTRHFLSPEAQSRFGGARIDAIVRIGELAVTERCDFVVVSGDVFESNHVERQVIARALEAMARTPGVTFYLLPGNHDPLNAASVFRSRTFVDRCPANVVVLDSSGVVPVTHGVEIVAAPWFTKRPLSDLVAEAVATVPFDPQSVADQPARSVIRIAVGHGAIDSVSPDSSDPSLIGLVGLERALSEGRVAFVALGDRHSTTSVGESGRVWYSGAPEPTDYVETDPGNALVVEIDGPDVRVEPHDLGAWRFVRHEADLADIEDCRRLAAWFESLGSKDRTIVKLGLTGQLSLAANAVLEEILALHGEVLGALELWEGHVDLVVLPDQLDLEHLALSGFARDAVVDLRDAAEAGGTASVVARDALALLYRLGRVAS